MPPAAGAAEGGLVDDQLAEITRRLQPEWPEADVARLVAAAYRRLAEGARITSYLPILAERLARNWLQDGQTRADSSTQRERAA